MKAESIYVKQDEENFKYDMKLVESKKQLYKTYPQQDKSEVKYLLRIDIQEKNHKCNTSRTMEYNN